MPILSVHYCYFCLFQHRPLSVLPSLSLSLSLRFKLSAYARRAAENELQVCDSLKDVVFLVKPMHLVNSTVLDALESSSASYSDSLYKSAIDKEGELKEVLLFASCCSI